MAPFGGLNIREQESSEELLKFILPRRLHMPTSNQEDPGSGSLLGQSSAYHSLTRQALGSLINPNLPWAGLYRIDYSLISAGMAAWEARPDELRQLGQPGVLLQFRQDLFQIDQERQELALTAQGSVDTEDGRHIDFELSEFMGQEVTTLSHQGFSVASVPLIDPLVLDLDGSGIGFDTTHFDFDLDSDGILENLASLNEGSGFLAYDRNRDGVIGDGSELFGPGSGNGFADLGQYDLDGNFWIDENDAIYTDLAIWQPNDDGQGMLMDLKEADVGAISLTHASSFMRIQDAEGALQGQINGSGFYLSDSGQARSLHQVDMAAQGTSSQAASDQQDSSA